MFPREQTLEWGFVGRNMAGECSGDQHLWRLMKRWTEEQMDNRDTVTKKFAAGPDPSGAPGLGWSFRGVPAWGNYCKAAIAYICPGGRGMNLGNLAFWGWEQFPERDPPESSVANTLNSWRMKALSCEGRDLGGQPWHSYIPYVLLIRLSSFFAKSGASLSYGTVFLTNIFS